MALEGRGACWSPSAPGRWASTAARNPEAGRHLWLWSTHSPARWPGGGGPGPSPAVRGLVASGALLGGQLQGLQGLRAAHDGEGPLPGLRDLEAVPGAVADGAPVRLHVLGLADLIAELELD